jgi:hypothetical protein
MRTYPLQTGPNCGAYSYFVALQEALYLADPFRKLATTPQLVEKATGAPMVADGDAELNALRTGGHCALCYSWRLRLR